MKAVAVVAFMAFAGVRVADAACANQCSGHGRCTNWPATYSATPLNHFKPDSGANALGYDTTLTRKDTCTCFLRLEGEQYVYDWTAPDCSEKTCPSAAAVFAVPYASNDHTQVVECAGVGTCNRDTGECECQKGFTGKDCSRRKCPNDCNGRGRCELLETIVESIVVDASSFLQSPTTSFEYDAFDFKTSAGCICDAGFRGADCSLQECPSSADPMGGLGKESGRECSGRGTCAYDTGVCDCFDGYTGTACDVQLANLA